MKRLLMITSAIGLCLAAPAFAQAPTEQEQNKQQATPPSSSAPAAQSQERQRSNQQGGQAQQLPSSGSSSPSSAQAPADRNQNQAQQPSSGSSSPSSAQAPADRNQAQKPASSSSPSSAQAPADQKKNQAQQPASGSSGQAQNQRQPADNKTNAQAPADQQRSATDRNRAQTRQSQQDNQRQNRESSQPNRDRSTASNININETQRTRIATAFSSVNIRPVNVNFRVAVGVVVPRTVVLRTVPTNIVEIVPQFRGYSYFATGDQIVIVEPRGKTVVAVLPAGGAARAQAPATNRTSFSEEQREIIRKRASTLRSTATTGSSASRIVVEEEVPATIELQEFPAEIVTEVPTIRTYRYFRQDNDVIVVDPAQRRVIEVIR